MTEDTKAIMRKGFFKIGAGIVAIVAGVVPVFGAALAAGLLIAGASSCVFGVGCKILARTSLIKTAETKNRLNNIGNWLLKKGIIAIAAGVVASVPFGLVAAGAASVVEGSVNAGLKREFSLGPFGLAGMTHRLLNNFLLDNQKIFDNAEDKSIKTSSTKKSPPVPPFVDQDEMPLYPPPPTPTKESGRSSIWGK